MNDSDFLRFEQLYNVASVSDPHLYPLAFSSEQAAAFRVLWPEFVRLRAQLAALRAAFPSAEVLRRAAAMTAAPRSCHECIDEYMGQCGRYKLLVTKNPLSRNIPLCDKDAATLRQAAAALEKLEER